MEIASNASGGERSQIALQQDEYLANDHVAANGIRIRLFAVCTSI